MNGPMFNRQRIVAVLVITSTLLIVGCGSAQAVTVTVPNQTPSTTEGRSVSEINETDGRVWLEAPIGNFQTGWATLSEIGSDLKIEIDVAPAEASPQPAHVHLGTCSQLADVAYKLENIVGGHSVTVIPDIGIRDVATGGLAVNLHLSFDDFPTFTACGEIPRIVD